MTISNIMSLSAKHSTHVTRVPFDFGEQRRELGGPAAAPLCKQRLTLVEEEHGVMDLSLTEQRL